MNNIGWLNDIDDGLKNYVKTSVECVKGAYDTGYKNGKNVKTQDARQKGREEAWEMARKLVLAELDGGLSRDKIAAIFGMTDEFEVLDKCSIGQVLEAYKEYKEKDLEAKKVSEIAFETYRNDQLRYVYFGKTTADKYTVLQSDLSPCEVLERIKLGVLSKNSFTIHPTNYGGQDDLERACRIEKVELNGAFPLEKELEFRGNSFSMEGNEEWKIEVKSLFLVKKVR